MTQSRLPAAVSPWRSYWLAAIVILLLHIPFYWTHHVSEDAYITFRTAFHLADHGVFSFNLDGHTPGTTSALHPLLIAALRILFGSHAIVALQVFATIAVLVGAFLASSALAKTASQRFWLFVFASLTPVALEASYTGMEAPFLILLIGLLLSSLNRPDSILRGSLCLYLLPLVRPDAVAISCLTIAALLLLKRKKALWSAYATLLGVASLMMFNLATSGSLGVETARAKEISYHPSFAPSALLHRALDIIFRNSFSAPLNSKFLIRFLPAFGMLALILSAYLLYRFRKDRPLLVVLAWAVAIVFCLPLAYALGGVVFNWYLMPSNWLLDFLGIFLVLEVTPFLSRPTARTILSGLAVVLVLFDGLTLVTSLNTGTQEFHYRGDVGRYLGERSHHQGTLFLEPAGVIPFFSEIKTVDEVGLVADDVLKYMAKFPEKWWIRYVQEQQPTYIVQRGAFLRYTNYQGYTLTAEEVSWFDAHYTRIRAFHYDPALYFYSPWMVRILSHGFHQDYLVYELSSRRRS
jgi:hypothetical protein